MLFRRVNHAECSQLAGRISRSTSAAIEKRLRRRAEKGADYIGRHVLHGIGVGKSNCFSAACGCDPASATSQRGLRIIRATLPADDEESQENPRATRRSSCGQATIAKPLLRILRGALRKSAGVF